MHSTSTYTEVKRVLEPYMPFTLKGAANELREPFPDNNEWGQQTAVWELLKLAETLRQRVSHLFPDTTEQHQDDLLNRLYSQHASRHAETIQAASERGLITISRKSNNPVNPVFLMDDNLAAAHADLHFSLHRSGGQSKPPTRLEKYTQTHRMYRLAKAIYDNGCDKSNASTMQNWKEFLGSEQVSNDHESQADMGMFTKSENKREGWPSYIIPERDYWPSRTISNSPEDSDIREILLKCYDEQLSEVNSELRDCLRNIIFVDMTDATLETLKVPTTFEHFLAWRETERSQITNPLNVRTPSGLHHVGLPRTVRSETMKEVWGRLTKEAQNSDKMDKTVGS